jgi:hypothetical protein
MAMSEMKRAMPSSSGPIATHVPSGRRTRSAGENSIPLKQAFNGFAGELISPDCGTR